MLGSNEAANEAFLRVVARTGTTVAEFLRFRERSGEPFQLRIDTILEPAKRPDLLRQLLEDRDATEVHLRAVSRSARVGRKGGLDTPNIFELCPCRRSRNHLPYGMTNREMRRL